MICARAAVMCCVLAVWNWHMSPQAALLQMPPRHHLKMAADVAEVVNITDDMVQPMHCETTQHFLSVLLQRFLTSALPVAQAAQYLKQTGHVNTYTFTKMLTEMAIAEFHNSSFPVAIVRPSIVVSAAAPDLPATSFCLGTGVHGCIAPHYNPCKVCKRQLHAERSLQRHSCTSRYSSKGLP